MALRVIAGEFGGRRLAAPRGTRTRPTTDRVKESVFSALGPDRLTGVSVLDLFAGSGALGIEALSRGALHAQFVERDHSARAVIDDNLASLDVASRSNVWGGDVEQFLRATPSALAPFDLVLVDPPYDLPDDALVSLLSLLAAPIWLRPDATVVIERSGRARASNRASNRASVESLTLPAGWRSVWERTFGDTLIVFAMT